MKGLFVVLMLLAITQPCLALDIKTMLEAGDKCLAAFRKDPRVYKLIAPIPFCTCVGEYISRSEKDRTTATDEAGLYCFQLIRPPYDSQIRGATKGHEEACLADADIRTIYPGTYKSFCSCYGREMAKLSYSTKSGHTSLQKALDSINEKSISNCMK